MSLTKSRPHRVAVLLFALASGAAANAATYIITYTGNVSANGLDVTGVFGPANTSLEGEEITAVFTLTDPTPGAFVSNDGITGFTDGGTLRGYPIPVVSEFTIKGITRTVGVDTEYFGEVLQVNSPGFDQVRHWNQDLRLATASIPGVINVLQVGLASTTNNIVNSSNFTDPLDYIVQPGDFPSGTFQILTVAVDDTVLEFAVGNLSLTRITIALAPQQIVPEPASWALLIVGFGLTGSALRKRRTAEPTLG